MSDRTGSERTVNPSHVSGRRTVMNEPVARREFLRAGGVAAAAIMTGVRAAGASHAPGIPRRLAEQPTRQLGRTSVPVGLVSLGGQGALARADNEAAALAIIERALDLGVNYLDTGVAYGPSQRYIGQVMTRRRSQVFLASKTADRTSEGACRDIDNALVALQTDHIDLWLMDRVRTMNEVMQITAPGGALEGFLYAKEMHQTRFLGITGVANPTVLMELLRRSPALDCVMVGIHAADRHRLSFAAELLPLAAGRQAGIIAMDVTAGGRLLSTFTPPPPEAGRPALVPGPLSLQEALNYVWSLDVATAVLDAESVTDVEEYVRLANAFAPLSEQDMSAIAERTRAGASQLLYLRQAAT